MYLHYLRYGWWVFSWLQSILYYTFICKCQIWLSFLFSHRLDRAFEGFQCPGASHPPLEREQIYLRFSRTFPLPIECYTQAVSSSLFPNICPWADPRWYKNSQLSDFWPFPLWCFWAWPNIFPPPRPPNEVPLLVPLQLPATKPMRPQRSAAFCDIVEIPRVDSTEAFISCP